MGVGFSVVIVPSTDRNNIYEDELSRRLEEATRARTLRVLALELGGRDPLDTNSFDGITLGEMKGLPWRVLSPDSIAEDVAAITKQIEERGMPGALIVPKGILDASK